MPVRVPSLLDPPVGFAHGGAGAHEDAQTTEAYSLAVKLGATGVSGDAWVTADGEVVVHREGSVRAGLRRRPIAELTRAALPADVPTLGQVFETCGPDRHVSLDVAEADQAARIVAAAREVGAAAGGRLWLCTAERDTAAGWVGLAEEVRVVVSVRFRHLERVGAERQAAAMAQAGIDAVRMPYDDWRSGRTTLLHRFGVLALGSAAVHRRQLDDLLGMGIDGLYSAHVDRMVDALSAVT